MSIINYDNKVKMVKSLENLDKSIINQNRIYGLEEALDSKQENLVSGENIKTINNESVLGSGNLYVNPLPQITYEHLQYSSFINLETNKVYTLTIEGDITFRLPTPEANRLNQILVQCYMETPYNINYGTTNYFGFMAPDVSSGGYFDIIWEYDIISNKWIAGVLHKILGA